MSVENTYRSTEKWLFPGQRKDGHISTRTAQAIFEKARNKTGVEKDVKAFIHNPFALEWS